MTDDEVDAFLEVLSVDPSPPLAADVAIDVDRFRENRHVARVGRATPVVAEMHRISAVVTVGSGGSGRGDSRPRALAASSRPRA